MNCPVCGNLEERKQKQCGKCGFTFTSRSIFSRLLNRRTVHQHDYINGVIEFLKQYNKLVTLDKYVAKSEYLSLIKDNKHLYTEIMSLKKTNLLTSFSNEYNFAVDNILKYLDIYEQFEKLIDKHNDKFVKKELFRRKNYLDRILYKCDKNILLDDEQREVVVSDEDYTLVIAGAGSGKTTTVAAKVKYLVDIKQINPSEILVITFTNKAVKELKDRINKDLQIDCPITTFHSTGNAIIRKTNPERLKIVDDSDIYFIIRNYLAQELNKDKEMLKKLILFFGCYFDLSEADVESKDDLLSLKDRASLLTLKSKLNEFTKEVINQRTKKKITIRNEQLRSQQEVQIANFLYLNGLDYEYEKVYPYKIEGARKLYTPDFYVRQGDKEVYIEHFGISESGHNENFAPQELKKYKLAIKDKVFIHFKHNTDLITTYSSYTDGEDLLLHLKEELIKRGFELKEKDDEEIYNKIVSNQDDNYVNRFSFLAARFINNFKVNGYTDVDFSKMRAKTRNVRNLLFFDIMEKIYHYYQSYLIENNAVDFDDMINESVRLLKEAKELKNSINFKYIVIDEYQDISRQRYNLAKVLSDVTGAKIIAVGDDWQSIYAFAGSDITLFLEFKKLMGYAKLQTITRTYRNAQELIDIAGTFIQKNSAQIRKKLKSHKTIAKPVVVFTYDDDIKDNRKMGFSSIRDAKAKLIAETIGKIVKVDGDNKEILLLGRYNFDGEQLTHTSYFQCAKKDNYSQLICTLHPTVKLYFMTAHSSKGLTANNVIIINAIHSKYGFPSHIEEDPVFKFVIRDDQSYEYAEERRLFYVALTRTKNRVFIITPKTRPSVFVRELVKEYKGVTLHGEMEFDVDPIFKHKYTCPNCGYPLLYRRNTNYGLNLYICANEPEICDFMTNIPLSKGNIHLCSACDGFMIVKKPKDKNYGYFFGCTNYNDGKGCKNLEKIVVADEKQDSLTF